jgi:hypothetical protein
MPDGPYLRAERGNAESVKLPGSDDITCRAWGCFWDVPLSNHAGL